MELKEKYQLAYKKIKFAKNILLVTHARPDGDAVSSICAVMLLLEELNKKYTATCLHTPPEQLLFLPLAEKIQANINTLDFSSYDLIIALDCGSLSRTNLNKQITNRKKNQFVMEFDHHPKIDDYANLEIRIPEASSTAEVLYGFFRTNVIKINKKIANCILTGILTDTGNFLYPSTTDKTVDIASEMLLHGAKYPRITDETWRNKSFGAMKLWGKAIGGLEINEKYNLAYTVLTKKDLEDCACSDEEMEGISGFLSNLYGVKGLLLLREVEDDVIKGSLRTSHPDVDISKLAQYLGGGGHKKASGFFLKGKLEKIGGKWKVR
jgi:phosphoesterase RecJ-like protein